MNLDKSPLSHTSQWQLGPQPVSSELHVLQVPRCFSCTNGLNTGFRDSFLKAWEFFFPFLLSTPKNNLNIIYICVCTYTYTYTYTHRWFADDFLHGFSGCLWDCCCFWVWRAAGDLHLKVDFGEILFFKAGNCWNPFVLPHTCWSVNLWNLSLDAVYF